MPDRGILPVDVESLLAVDEKDAGPERFISILILSIGENACRNIAFQLAGAEPV